MISSNLKFKRDADLENSACNEVMDFFLDGWESTSKKTSKTITALVLSQIKDACITVVSDNESKEHLKLLHANTYFEKWINLLQSREALPIAIKGKQFEDIIENLERIKTAAKGEEFEKDIVSRLNLFINQLKTKATEIYISCRKQQRKETYARYLYPVGAVIIAYILAALIYLL